MKTVPRTLPALLLVLLFLPGCVMPGGVEWIVIGFIALLLFGSSRLPGMMRSLGSGLNEFKKGLKEGESGSSGDGEGDKPKEVTGDKDAAGPGSSPGTS